MTAKNESLDVGSLVVRNFEAHFGDFAIRADFEAAPRERVALFAPSGSGKTTLLRWIAGISDHAAGTARVSGRVKIGDRDITTVPPESREVGFVFQDYALFPALTALENVAFGLEMRGVPARERKERAIQWLENVGLAGRAKTEAGYLSGGEKQRVALARALIWKPKLLLLDEPFAALDLAHRKSAREIVRSVLEKDPVPMVFVTHDEADVRELATRTIAYAASEDGSEHRFG